MDPRMVISLWYISIQVLNIDYKRTHRNRKESHNHYPSDQKSVTADTTQSKEPSYFLIKMDNELKVPGWIMNNPRNPQAN